jgi:hypothetical protein
VKFSALFVSVNGSKLMTRIDFSLIGEAELAASDHGFEIDGPEGARKIDDQLDHGGFCSL